jgi:hypothetical protein
VDSTGVCSMDCTRFGSKASFRRTKDCH